MEAISYERRPIPSAPAPAPAPASARAAGASETAGPSRGRVAEGRASRGSTTKYVEGREESAAGDEQAGVQPGPGPPSGLHARHATATTSSSVRSAAHDTRKGAPISPRTELGRRRGLRRRQGGDRSPLSAPRFTAAVSGCSSTTKERLGGGRIFGGYCVTIIFAASPGARVADVLLEVCILE